MQVVANTVLDLLLVVGFGAGVVGAAWGTVITQYLGAALLLRRMYTAGRVRYQPGLPHRVDLALLWATLAPLAVVYVARNLSYMQIQVAAAALVPVQVAAHQAVRLSYPVRTYVVRMKTFKCLNITPELCMHSLSPCMGVYTIADGGQRLLLGAADAAWQRTGRGSRSCTVPNHPVLIQIDSTPCDSITEHRRYDSAVDPGTHS